MELDDFIKNFANQFDDTELEEFSAGTIYRNLDEWTSLIGLAVLNMIAKKYGVKLSPVEMRATSTIEELYKLVNSKL